MQPPMWISGSALASGASDRVSAMNVFLILGQVVGDREPRRLGAYEDVLARADAGRVDQRAEQDVHECAVAHDGVEERATHGAAHVARVWLAVDEQAVAATAQVQLAALDAGK